MRSYLTLIYKRVFAQNAVMIAWTVLALLDSFRLKLRCFINFNWFLTDLLLNPLYLKLLVLFAPVRLPHLLALILRIHVLSSYAYTSTKDFYSLHCACQPLFVFILQAATDVSTYLSERFFNLDNLDVSSSINYPLRHQIIDLVVNCQWKKDNVLLSHHKLEVAKKTVYHQGRNRILKGNLKDKIAPGNMLHWDEARKPAEPSGLFRSLWNSLPHEGEDEWQQAIAR